MVMKEHVKVRLFCHYNYVVFFEFLDSDGDLWHKGTNYQAFKYSCDTCAAFMWNL